MIRCIVCVFVMVIACDYPRTDPPINDGSAANCISDATRCNANMLETCQDSHWTPTRTCADLCSAGACVIPPSCSGGVKTCGPTGSDSCCRSAMVDGGTFSRSYDAVTSGFTDPQYRATVSTFALDVYEVTVARFQAFAAAYPANEPAVGSGANPHDQADTGWDGRWTESLPKTRNDLMLALNCEGLTSQLATDPVRCVSWYVALAFCIWDGGRLPTEAEWNYAASGGDQQRVYPWSMPPTGVAISSANATYATGQPTSPGIHSPSGDGRWAQADLSGNVAEWTYDYYSDPYPTSACNDCANHTIASYRSMRGETFISSDGVLRTSLRNAADPAITSKLFGFRCARNPLP